MRDPVCGMQVNDANASTKSEHNGNTYYFCSPGCKVRFDADPERLLGQHEGRMSHSPQAAHSARMDHSSHPDQPPHPATAVESTPPTITVDLKMWKRGGNPSQTGEDTCSLHPQ